MPTAVSLDRARAAKMRLGKLLPGSVSVSGIGITQVGEDYAVKVNLASAPPSELTLPQDLDGVPIVFEVVGTISARKPRP